MTVCCRMKLYFKSIIVLLILTPFLLVVSLYFLLRYDPGLFLPSSLQRVIQGGSFEYDPIQGRFQLNNLVLEDVKSKYLLKLPETTIEYDLSSQFNDRNEIILKSLHIQKVQIVFINKDDPSPANGVVKIHEGIPAFFRKQLPPVLIQEFGITDGFMDFLDHTGKKGQIITHTIREIDFLAHSCRIRDLSGCSLDLRFSLNTEGSRYPASRFEATLRPLDDGSPRALLNFHTSNPIFLRQYDRYLRTRGYRILSGFAHLKGDWLISEDEIYYNNRLTIYRLGLEDRSENVTSFFKNMLLPAYLDYISDARGTIRISSSGRVILKKGTKFALRKIKGNLIRSVGRKISGGN